jgi:hypothetical protein
MESDHETSVALPKAVEAHPGVVEDYCRVVVADLWRLTWSYRS